VSPSSGPAKSRTWWRAMTRLCDSIKTRFAQRPREMAVSVTCSSLAAGGGRFPIARLTARTPTAGLTKKYKSIGNELPPRQITAIRKRRRRGAHGASGLSKICARVLAFGGPSPINRGQIRVAWHGASMDSDRRPRAASISCNRRDWLAVVISECCLVHEIELAGSATNPPF